MSVQNHDVRIYRVCAFFTMRLCACVWKQSCCVQQIQPQVCPKTKNFLSLLLSRFSFKKLPKIYTLFFCWQKVAAYFQKPQTGES